MNEMSDKPGPPGNLKKSVGQASGRSGLVAALDLGTTKACCLIARQPGPGELEIVGIGHQISRGLRAGSIVDMEMTEATIRATVGAAEQMAGENIRNVIVNVSCGAPRSRLIAYGVSIAGHEICDADLRRLLEPAGLPESERQGRDILHAIPVGYSIDGNKGVRDPRGLHGQRLGVNMHVISVERDPLNNLETGVARCHLDLSGKVASPYASSLASLSEDEIGLGVTCIDMGGGTTSVAIFFDGELVHTDSLALGGSHVTSDIARGLSTPLAHAERMKTLYGSAIPTPADDREIIKTPLIGEEQTGETSQVPRSLLIGIIRPRIEEIFEILRDRLEESGFDKIMGSRLVLTGGASQLSGVREMAGEMLNMKTRLGRPKPLRGLAESASGPAFSTCVGLLRFAADNTAEGAQRAYRPDDDPGGRFARLGKWLRENF